MLEIVQIKITAEKNVIEETTIEKEVGEMVSKKEMEGHVKIIGLIEGVEVEVDLMEEEDIKGQEVDPTLLVNVIMEDLQEDMKVENIHVQDHILALAQMVKFVIKIDRYRRDDRKIYRHKNRSPSRSYS